MEKGGGRGEERKKDRGEKRQEENKERGDGWIGDRVRRIVE